LYWSARAHDQLGGKAIAVDRYTLVTADYLNSYYGRLAVARLDGRRAPARIFSEAPASLLPPPPNEPLVRALLDIGRYEDALNEVRYAHRARAASTCCAAGSTR
jgi:hypothetical protein